METSLKENWLEALRSGKYRKSRQRLYDKKRKAHCCLGVLRDVAHLSDPDEATALYADSLDRVDLTGAEQAQLIKLNDEHGGWDEVCKYIEKHL